MGRLRFALTNVVFWIVLVLSCLLSENYAVFNNNPRSGFDLFPAFFLSFGVIILLLIYYFLEHKKNNLTFDKVLLPIFIICGLMMIWTIFRQDNRSFLNWEGNDYFAVSFSFNERLLAALQVVIWLMVLYALVFVYNRFRLLKESYRWVAKLFLIIVVIFAIIDVFYEKETISAILNGSYYGPGVEFIMGNANVWGLLLFSGIITALILSYKKFRWYYYLAMILLYQLLFLTMSSDAIFVSSFVIFSYTVYEIVMLIINKKKIRIRLSIIFSGIILAIVGLCFLFVAIKVPFAINIKELIEQKIINKDYSTITGRTVIWSHIFDLLKANLLDFIFGLGHETGSKIFHIFNANYMPVKSAHNGVMEVFLRYGLLGAIIYVGVLLLTMICLIIHIKKKRYRFAFIYGLAYFAIVIHSIAESTNIFLPNTGGMYFGLIFIMPIINILQSKKFAVLKEQSLQNKVEKSPISKNNFLTIFVLFLSSIVISKIVSYLSHFDLFMTLLTFILVLMLLMFIAILTNSKSIIKINNNIYSYYISKLEAEKDE